MRIVISGSHGLIGSALRDALIAQHHDVFRLVRSEPEGPDQIRWQPDEGTIDAAGLEGMDAVVHLAGESVLGPWTDRKRKRIRESRVNGTSLLARTLAKLEHKPAVLVSASAVGYYGDHGNQRVDENTPAGDDFLAHVAREWEQATQPAADAGIRVAIPRIAVVLSSEGGALKMALPIFRLGMGGRVGSGQQYMSWITLPDMVAVLEHLITEPGAEGAYNAAAPGPVTNAQFTQALAAAVHRPALVPLHASIVKLLLGDAGRQTVLASTRAVPDRLEARGFRFTHVDLTEALASLL